MGPDSPFRHVPERRSRRPKPRDLEKTPSSSMMFLPSSTPSTLLPPCHRATLRRGVRPRGSEVGPPPGSESRLVQEHVAKVSARRGGVDTGRALVCPSCRGWAWDSTFGREGDARRIQIAHDDSGVQLRPDADRGSGDKAHGKGFAIDIHCRSLSLPIRRSLFPCDAQKADAGSQRSTRYLSESSPPGLISRFLSRQTAT